jgi:hypothetical protein
MMVTPTEDEHIATLVYSDEYARYANQMASVSSQKLIFVKRKELAMKPYELLEFPISQCSSISYETKWAVVPMIFGALLVALLLFIFSSRIPAGTQVPIGALAVALIFGVVLLRGPKRHRLTFFMNGKKLVWQSKAGDYKYKVASTTKVVSFARDKGLLVQPAR